MTIRQETEQDRPGAGLRLFHRSGERALLPKAGLPASGGLWHTAALPGSEPELHGLPPAGKRPQYPRGRGVRQRIWNWI